MSHMLTGKAQQLPTQAKIYIYKILTRCVHEENTEYVEFISLNKYIMLNNMCRMCARGHKQQYNTKIRDINKFIETLLHLIHICCCCRNGDLTLVFFFVFCFSLKYIVVKTLASTGEIKKKKI